MARTRRHNPHSTSPWPFVGMAGMAAVLFLYGVSGLVAPWYGVLVLLAVWVALFVTACRWWTPHPTWVPWLPVAALVVWFVVVTAGGAWLGWTA